MPYDLIANLYEKNVSTCIREEWLYTDIYIKCKIRNFLKGVRNTITHYIVINQYLWYELPLDNNSYKIKWK